MSALALAFALLMGAVLQAVLPAPAWTGFAPTPILASLVVYYALLRSRGTLIFAAVLAGIVEDSLGQMPLGYTSFFYALAGLGVEYFRETVVVRQWTTHVMFGAVVNLAVSLAIFLLLAKDGLVSPPAPLVALRLAGAFVLGGVTAPIVFHAMQSLEETLGIVEAEEDA